MLLLISSCNGWQWSAFVYWSDFYRCFRSQIFGVSWHTASKRLKETGVFWIVLIEGLEEIKDLW